MDAFVTVRYQLVNICDERDLIYAGMTFDEMVRLLIAEGSVLGFADNPNTGEILSVERVPSTDEPELPL